MNYALFYPTSENQQHLLFIFYFLPFFLGNFFSVSLPLTLSLSICRGKGQKQWEEFFLLIPLPLVCLPPFLVLNSLFFSPCLTLEWMWVFLFCREQYWFYTPGNERIQLDKEFSGSESLLFPVVLFVFFTSLLAAHKSAKLLINGTARYHIFTLEMQSKLSQSCSTALKNETITTRCKVLKELSCRHCPRVASTWLNESFKGKI